MAKKDVIDTTVEEVKEETGQPETKALETFKFGVNPNLVVAVVRENRVYRFEMPIGAKLTECIEACTECLKITNNMLAESEAKQAEALKKKKEADSDIFESNDIDPTE